VRVDLFLRVSGLLRTRTLAGRACDGGFVSVNGRTAKPSTEVRPGDRISLVLPDGSPTELTVDSLPAGRSVARRDRHKLYTAAAGGPERDG